MWAGRRTDAGSGSLVSTVMQPTVAIIPAAGRGTRFLPATKAVPKELFPLGDQPALQLVIDEALGADIEHIVVVTSRDKPAIEAYLEPSPALIAILREAGRDEAAARLAGIGREWRVSVVHQDEPLGLGHAVGCAAPFVHDAPVAVLLPDELMQDSSLLIELGALGHRHGSSAVALKEVAAHEVSAYGVVDAVTDTGSSGALRIRGLVEKPHPDDAPSRLVIIGRYVLTPDIFDDISALRPGTAGELQLTDALIAQAERRSLFGVVSTIGRHDTGTPLGYLLAAVAVGLRSDELRAQLLVGLRRSLEEYEER